VDKQSNSQNNDAQSDSKSNSDGVLSRVHQLGQASESLFRRLYGGFARKKEEATIAMPVQDLYEQYEAQQAIQRKEKEDALATIKERDKHIAQLLSVFEALDDGIIIQNDAGKITLINASAKELIGNEQRFWTSDLRSLFTQPDQLEEIDVGLQPLGRAETVEINGRVLAVQIGAIGDPEERLGTIMVLRDITKDTFADRIRNSIITSISHEFKTPMAVMRVASEILMSQPEDEPANNKMLEKLSKNIDILDRMVIELLDVSEMTSGTFDVRRDPLHMETLMGEVTRGFYPEVKKARLELKLNGRGMRDLHILGDESRLKWALGHVIRNAIAYTPRDGKIDIHCYPHTYKVDTPQLVIRIKDSGVGISDEDLPQIFDLFFRGKPRTKEGKLIDPRGLGQGLYIAQQVIQAHDGAIFAESDLYDNSAFSVSLPIAPLLDEGAS